MITKLKIKNNFDKASDSYEQVASIQKESARFLVKKILTFDRDFYPQKILDLGSGTGYVPELLLGKYTQSLYTLNDISPKMIEKLKYKFINRSDFHFCLGDMETMNFGTHQLITSNLVFQWAHNLWEILHKSYLQCNVFAFSCLLNGTFFEWQNILKKYGIPAVVRNYPTKEEIISFLHNLSSSKLYFHSKNFYLKFPSAYFFIKYLSALGAGMSDFTIPSRALKSLLVEHDRTLTATYKIFFAILKRDE